MLILEILKSLAFLKGMTHALISYLASQSVLENYSEGQSIPFKEDPAKFDFLFVVKGSISCATKELVPIITETKRFIDLIQ